eukprot:322628-Prorocentrum_minimum.AAC.1
MDQSGTAAVVTPMSKIRSDSRTYGVREQWVGELDFRVTRWLNKGLTVNFAVSTSSPNVRTRRLVTC